VIDVRWAQEDAVKRGSGNLLKKSSGKWKREEKQPYDCSPADVLYVSRVAKK
jgi:hypothetical protein